MKINEWLTLLKTETPPLFSRLYADPRKAAARFEQLLLTFSELYGSDRDVSLFSVPGRSEISGNHTDHNHGCVLAGAINRDIIAVAAKSEEPRIRIKSEGYPENAIDLSEIDDPKNFEEGKSDALVAGMAAAFRGRGMTVGGFDACTSTEVLKGSGLSSSAAFEVMVGTIENALWQNGALPNTELAKMAQFSENVYFGKPSGLMDQMACAVGGFVFIDFLDPKSPVVKPLAFSLDEAGYALAIVNTGGNHADLTPDYAAVPAEMKAVAAHFGRPVLRGLTEGDLIAQAKAIREKIGDRALLRAIHYVRENDRVMRGAEALEAGELDRFLGILLSSGRSSFEYLQNVYSPKNPEEQGLSLALALADGSPATKGGAFRVHGGGFAGTVQIFLKKEMGDELTSLMDGVFGEGATMMLSLREVGATEILPQ